MGVLPSLGVRWQTTALGRQLPLGCRPPGQRRAHDHCWDGPPFAIRVAAESSAGGGAQLNQDGEPYGTGCAMGCRCMPAVRSGRESPT